MAYFDEFQPALLIADVELPAMDGLTLLKKLGEDPIPSPPSSSPERVAKSTPSPQSKRALSGTLRSCSMPPCYMRSLSALSARYRNTASAILLQSLLQERAVANAAVPKAFGAGR